jgi:hypothetical protein
MSRTISSPNLGTLEWFRYELLKQGARNISKSREELVEPRGVELLTFALRNQASH